jgi:two-component system, NtrC family, sensor kinase
VQPVLDTVVETAARLCGADTAIITIREGEVYRPVANNYMSAADAEYWETLRQRRFVPGRDSMTGRVALEGRVVHVEDLAADPDFALPEAVASGRRTQLGVPLLREGALLSLISQPRLPCHWQSCARLTLDVRGGTHGSAGDYRPGR